MDLSLAAYEAIFQHLLENNGSLPDTASIESVKGFFIPLRYQNGILEALRNDAGFHRLYLFEWNDKHKSFINAETGDLIRGFKVKNFSIPESESPLSHNQILPEGRFEGRSEVRSEGRSKGKKSFRSSSRNFLIYVTREGKRKKVLSKHVKMDIDPTKGHRQAYIQIEDKVRSPIDNVFLSYKKDITLPPLEAVGWLLVARNPDYPWIFPKDWNYAHKNDLRPSILWIFLQRQFRDCASIIADYLFPEMDYQLIPPFPLLTDHMTLDVRDTRPGIYHIGNVPYPSFSGLFPSRYFW